jgi:hypothetical protein
MHMNHALLFCSIDSSTVLSVVDTYSGGDIEA